MIPCVLAAIDLGPSSARVLLHAAGFARLLSAPLQVLYVARDATPGQAQRVLEFCAQQMPRVALTAGDVVVRTGIVSDAIRREAARQRARLVVIGARGHGGLVSMLLGSTSEAVLRNPPGPVLLVPPADRDIVNINGHATLSCGPVLAAIDLAEATDAQLRLAGEMAHLSGQPLLLLTIGRRGDVNEISHCAITEGAGLVVMGLTCRPRGRPGAIASAVLRANGAFVLAVPPA